MPSPAERPFTGVDKAGERRARVTADDKAPAAAFVWKTIADPFAGRITMFRVVSGTLKSDSTVHNVTSDAPERLGHLLLLQGKTQTHVPEIKAGDLGAVAKLKDTQTSDVLARQERPRSRSPPIKFPEPVLVLRDRAEEPRRRGQDQHRDAPAARRRTRRISYSRDPQTKELLLAGQGQLHIEVTVAKLKRRFGVEVNLKPPRIPVPRDDHGVDRGARPAQEADRRPRPVRRLQDQGRAAAARQRLRVRRRHLRRLDPAAVRPGGRKGHPGRAACAASSPATRWSTSAPRSSTARSTHVDSNELSFKMAGSLAFKDAMTRARPTILEPIMNVEVYAPSDFAGDLMGDLNGRRGRIAGMDTRGAMTVIRAQVPMSEMLTYEQHLTSATGGRGSYHMEYSHYEEVPPHLQAKIIAAAKAERGQEAVEEV